MRKLLHVALNLTCSDRIVLRIDGRTADNKYIQLRKITNTATHQQRFAVSQGHEEWQEVDSIAFDEKVNELLAISKHTH